MAKQHEISMVSQHLCKLTGCSGEWVTAWTLGFGWDKTISVYWGPALGLRSLVEIERGRNRTSRLHKPQDISDISVTKVRWRISLQTTRRRLQHCHGFAKLKRCQDYYRSLRLKVKGFKLVFQMSAKFPTRLLHLFNKQRYLCGKIPSTIWGSSSGGERFTRVWHPSFIELATKYEKKHVDIRNIMHICMVFTDNNTVDGQDPAPPRMMIFQQSQVVQDFFHQQYLLSTPLYRHISVNGKADHSQNPEAKVPPCIVWFESARELSQWKLEEKGRFSFWSFLARFGHTYFTSLNQIESYGISMHFSRKEPLDAKGCTGFSDDWYA